jgi:hypothetical protein
MTVDRSLASTSSHRADAPAEKPAEEPAKTSAEERAERRAIERAENEGFAPADREVRAAIARRRAELGTT